MIMVMFFVGGVKERIKYAKKQLPKFPTEEGCDGYES